MNRTAKLLGLALSSAFLVSFTQIPGIAKSSLTEAKFSSTDTLETGLLTNTSTLQFLENEKNSEILDRISVQGNLETGSNDMILNIEGRLEEGDETLSDGSLYDSYSFEGEAGQFIEICLSSTTFDTYLILVGPNGKWLEENDDSFGGLNSTIYIELPQAGNYLVLANAYDDSGKGEYALTASRISAERYRQFNHIEFNFVEINRLLDQGRQQYNYSQFQEALSSLQQSLDLYRENENCASRNHLLEYQVVFLLGDAHRILGRYQEALDFFEQSLSISREINNLYVEAWALQTLGLVYHDLGQYDRALELHQESLTIARELKDLSIESSALHNIGLAYYWLGQYERAVEYLNQALSTARMAEDKHAEMHALGNLGLTYSFLGQHELSLELLEQSIRIAREVGALRIEAAFTGNLGFSYRSLGQYERAINSYQQAIALLQTSGNRRLAGFFLGHLARTLAQIDQPELAIIFLKVSVDIRESLRDEIRNFDTKVQQSFTDTIADDYRLLADLLLQQGRIPEAQQVLDLLKLEELREFTDTRAVWTSNGLQLTAAEQTVADAHGSLIALGADLIECERTNCPDLRTLENRQEALLAQYDREVTRFTATIRDNRGDDGIFQDPERISGDAQDLLEAYAAEGETALLIYPFVLEDKLWLVWATVGNVIGSIEVPVARGELSATVQRLGELLQTGDTRNIAELQATSQQLYDWLIAPLEGELVANDIDHLVFVNDRVTRYIPMAVLHDGDQYLLERYTLSTVLAPGATEMGDRLGPVPETPVLGLGVTRPIRDFNALPAVGPELAAIVQGPEGDGVYPGQVFLDEAFTLDALERNVAAHRVLHIATHAEFVPGRKEESYILLGDGSPLRIPDIERIERRLNNLHLVVLSACQTALGGPDQDGAEIAGLSSYFLEARRAEAVIASLWSVNDTSTSVLMQRFYALLATGDFTKSEALRQAQLSLLNGEDLAALATRLANTRAGARPVLEAGTELPPDLGHRHPYHWAPFILIGNGL